MVKEKVEISRLEPNEIILLRKAFIGDFLGALIAFLFFAAIGLPAPFIPNKNEKTFHFPRSFEEYIREMSIWFILVASCTVLLAIFSSVPKAADLIGQKKLNGQWVIKRKWKTIKKYFFAVGPVKEVEVEKRIFDSFTEGDELKLQVAKFSKLVLSIDTIKY